MRSFYFLINFKTQLGIFLIDQNFIIKVMTRYCVIYGNKLLFFVTQPQSTTFHASSHTFTLSNFIRCKQNMLSVYIFLSFLCKNDHAFRGSGTYQMSCGMTIYTMGYEVVLLNVQLLDMPLFQSCQSFFLDKSLSRNVCSRMENTGRLHQLC